MTANRFLRCCICASIVALLLAGIPQPARAAAVTLYVDTFFDTNDIAYQACTDAPDDCSLRGAISRANGDTLNDYTLELTPNLGYTLTIEGQNERENATGDLNIRTDLVIHGANALLIPNQIDRALTIYNANVTIDSLTVFMGRAPNGADGVVGSPNGENGADGGAILAEGTGSLTLTNCTFFDNAAGDGGAGLAGEDAVPGVPAGNGATGGRGGSGGAVYLSSAVSGVFQSVVMESNRAGSGGIGGPGGRGDTVYPLAVAGGKGGAGGAGGSGGGIYSGTRLILTDSILRSNQAGWGGNGGDGGIGGSTTYDGAAGGDGGNGGWGGNGGGLSTIGLTANRSLISLNTAGIGGNGGSGGRGGQSTAAVGGAGGNGGDGAMTGSGGGVYMDTSSQNSSLTNTTLVMNRAGYGSLGGVGASGGWGAIRSGSYGANGINSAHGNGGALHLTGSSANTYLDFVTITGNMGIGGAFETHGHLYAKNSILAGNTNFESVENNCLLINAATTFDSLGNNIFGSAAYCDKQPSDLINATPGLLPLMDNGGPTQTMALSSDSPAINAATCTDHDGVAVTVDQRGSPRPGTLCDMGAFELAALPSLFFPLVVDEYE